jgi:hypothetical protein
MEKREPVKVLLLTMVTCGIYGIIWLSWVCDELNQGLGREEFNFAKELGLSIVTCGAWAMYFQWRLCEATVELERQYGAKPDFDAPILFVTTLFGLGPFFIQQSLNNAWDHAR